MSWRIGWPNHRSRADDLRERPIPPDPKPHAHFHWHQGVGRHAHIHAHTEEGWQHAHSSATR